MIVGLRPPEQTKIHETRHLIEMGVAFCPNPFEIRLAPPRDTESVHRDKHGRARRFLVRSGHGRSCGRVRRGAQVPSCHRARTPRCAGGRRDQPGERANIGDAGAGRTKTVRV